MKRKNAIIILLMLVLIIPLYGCKDKTEVEEQSYVTGLGLDKGRDNNLRITFQTINANFGGGGGRSAGGGGAQHKTETITFEAPDIISGRDLANISVARRIVFSHTRVLVIGEELARDENFYNYFDMLLREREMRRSMDIIVSKEEASAFLNNNDPKLENRVNKFYEFMARRWEETGMVPISDLNRFMQRTEEDASIFLAVYGTTKKEVPKTKAGYESRYLPGEVEIEGGNPTQLIGSAVFKEGRMIGTITGEENRIVALLRPKIEINSMVFTFPDPKNDKFRVTARVVRRKGTKIKIDVTGNKPKIDIKVPIDLEVIAIPSLFNYVSDLKNQKLLKNSIKTYLEERSYSFVERTQKNFKGEPFKWELAVRKEFSKYDEFKAYNWMEKYPEAEVKINFEVKIRSFGKQLDPPQMPEREEEAVE